MKSLTELQATNKLQELLAIPAGSGDEGAVVEYLRQQLLQAGAPSSAFKQDKAYRKSPCPGNTGNFVLRLRGTQRRPRRMLSAHMDTVPICVGAQPVRRGDRIEPASADTGLGGDDRAGVAVLLTTALAILKYNLPHPPLTFLWTVQEEVGLQGARNVKQSMLGNPQLGFNFDGRVSSQVTLGATGGYRMEIDIGGIASHAGGHPEQGVSAIAIAALATADLVENGWHGLIEKNGKVGTSNIGVFEGGAATNVVCNRVRILAEARSHDRRFRQRIVREIEKAFTRAVKKVRNHQGKRGTVEIDGRLDYESFRMPANSPAVLAASKAIAAEGHEASLTVANGGLDANWLNAHGIPTVTMGCGQHNIHTVSEWLDLPEFHRARRIALRLATDLD